MVNSFRRLIKILPTLITAFILAVAVWVLAVTSNDPTRQDVFPQPVEIELIGQDPGLVLVGDEIGTVQVTLSAPQSVWLELTNQQDVLRAVVDLSGLEPGTHILPVDLQVNARPVRVISYTPQTVEIKLETLLSNDYMVDLQIRGEPAIGYQAGFPTLDARTVTVVGPQSQAERVKKVRAVLDISGAQQSITRTITLQAVDAGEVPVDGLTIIPGVVTVTQPITQRFGYRSVVVNVVVTGQVAGGYRLTNISVFPPAVTVFSADPEIVNTLPGYVETLPLDLTGAKDDIDIFLNLNLPEGVSVVGDQTSVLVRVGIAAIESSLPFSNMPVEVVGLAAGFDAQVSPELVTVIISGPLPLLDALTPASLRVTVDVTGLPEGIHALYPIVELAVSDLVIQSILPETVEVVIARGGTATPRP